MPILKLKQHDEQREIAFELRYLRTLTTGERFRMMLQKSDEMRKLLKRHGYRDAAQILKRT
jgi:hypothetical protein